MAKKSANEIKLFDYFSTDMASNCPLIVECKKTSKIDDSLIDCDFVEATHTSVGLNTSTGVLSFQSSDPQNTEYPTGTS